MKAPTKLTYAQQKLLNGLLDGGGVFDRYYRVIANGAIIAHSGPTPLAALRHGWIEISDDRVVITETGRSIFARSQ